MAPNAGGRRPGARVTIESGMGVEGALVKANVHLLGYFRLVPRHN